MASSGNFCTLNPLDSGATLINGNLTLSHTSSAWRTAFGTMGVSSGKWYFESRQVNSASGNGFAIAIQRMSEGLNNKVWENYPGNSYSTYGYSYAFYTKGSGDASEKVHNNSFVTTSDITAGVAGDVYQIALDLDNNKVWFGKNNTWHNSGDPAGNSNETYSSLPAGTYCSAVSIYTTSSDYFTHNYGQDSTFGGVATAGGNADGNGFGDFAYAPPTGFLAICTGNLPISDDIDPAQTDDNFPGKQFDVVTYTGTGSTRSVSGLNFQPDLLWLKCRSISQSARLIDSNRGVSKTLTPADTQTQGTESNGVTSFNSDGFTIGSATGGFNTGSATYVAWAWRCNGGTTTSDSSGDITVTRQTNDVAKFSILTYTGSGSSGNTIAHGLGVKPAMTIIKQTNSSNGWNVWHQGNNNGDYDSFGELNSSGSWNQNQGSSGPFSAAPGTDYLTLTAYGQVNGSSNTYVAYVWADVEGMQNFGSFEGNADNNGPFVYTGFRPRLVFVKNTEATSPWVVWDSARNTFNAANKGLAWNADSTESDYTGYPIDILSNGFKLRTSNATVNSSHTWVYGAWSDVPFKYNNTF